MTAVELARAVRDSPGIAHKTDIRQACAALAELPPLPSPVGDDCAAIPDGDGYLLFAIEGMLESFVSAEPWFAGYCAVMVNISDVAAMGGRPIAVVDAIWSRDAAGAAEVWAGMQAASRTACRSSAVTRTRAARTATSRRPCWAARRGCSRASMRGRATCCWPRSICAARTSRPTRTGIAAPTRPGNVCAAISPCSPKSPKRDFAGPPKTSAAGACIDPGALPAPPGVPLERWLLSFPSFGYLLSVRPADADAICARFAARSIACAAIGTVDDSHVVRIRHAAEEAVFWDLAAEPFTGASAHART